MRTKKETEQMLEPVKGEDGYLYITLFKDGKAKKCRVDRLVAETFVPNPQNLPYIKHKDGNLTNNAAENLEWCEEPQ